MQWTFLFLYRYSQYLHSKRWAMNSCSLCEMTFYVVFTFPLFISHTISSMRYYYIQRGKHSVGQVFLTNENTSGNAGIGIWKIGLILLDDTFGLILRIVWNYIALSSFVLWKFSWMFSQVRLNIIYSFSIL